MQNALAMSECTGNCQTTCSRRRLVHATLSPEHARFLRDVATPTTAPSHRRRLEGTCPESTQGYLDCIYDCDPEEDDNSNQNNQNCETRCDKDPDDTMDCIAEKMGCDSPVRTCDLLPSLRSAGEVLLPRQHARA
jgi:hypothetical protein